MPAPIMKRVATPLFSKAGTARARAPARPGLHTCSQVSGCGSPGVGGGAAGGGGARARAGPGAAPPGRDGPHPPRGGVVRGAAAVRRVRPAPEGEQRQHDLGQRVLGLGASEVLTCSRLWFVRVFCVRVLLRALMGQCAVQASPVHRYSDMQVVRQNCSITFQRPVCAHNPQVAEARQNPDTVERVVAAFAEELVSATGAGVQRHSKAELWDQGGLGALPLLIQER